MEKEYKYMVCTRCSTFNHAPYIEDTMRGFAMQETSFPVVYVIVDDASSDGEPEKIRNFLREHFEKPYREEETDYASVICTQYKANPNCEFVVILLKYNHYSIKKNKLQYLEEWLVNAKYLAICEGDDYWIKSDKLQKQVDFLENNQEYGMVYTPFLEFNQVTGEKKEVGTSSQIAHDDHFKWDIIEQNVMIGTCTVLIRRELEHTIKLIEDDYKGFMMGDTQTWFNAARLSKVGYLDEPTGVYRKNLTGMTATFDQTRRARFIRNCLDAHLHLAYKYGAPRRTVRIIKDRFGIYCFNMYLRQGEYENAEIMNQCYYHDSEMLRLSIWLTRILGLKKLRILGPLHHIAGKLNIINMK